MRMRHAPNNEARLHCLFYGLELLILMRALHNKPRYRACKSWKSESLRAELRLPISQNHEDWRLASRLASASLTANVNYLLPRHYFIFEMPLYFLYNIFYCLVNVFDRQLINLRLLQSALTGNTRKKYHKI